jgi:sugar/nucleoside kinase (ribokinase family)
LDGRRAIARAGLPYHSPMNLICTGTIGIDTIETPGNARREHLLGGSGVYFAAAASFYTKPRLVAVVGDDFPDEFMDVIRAFKGVDTAGLEVRKGSKTFRWGGKYLDDMDRRETLFTELGVLEEAPPTIPEAFKDSEIAFLANSHPAIQGDLLSQLRKPRLTVADTMDLWINIAKDDLTRLLGRVDGLVLNFDEAELFTGKRNPVTAGRHLLDLGPRFVVIKKGEHGCILVHRDGLAALPAYPTEQVIDPTGAGDSFAGGLMGRLTATGASDPGSFQSVREALAHGTVVASFNVESFSLERLKQITPVDLHTRFADYASMIRI